MSQSHSPHYSVAANELRERLRLQFPVRVTLPDPISGQFFTVDRENLLAFLLVDSGQVEFEAQTVAAFYAEMARCQRGAERAQATAERQYRRWRSQVSQDYRQKAAKRVTDKEAEEAYRSHPDYDKISGLPTQFATLISLFGDMKEAFRLKAQMITSHSMLQRGYEASHPNEAAVQARLSELEKQVDSYAARRDEDTLKILRELGVGS